MCLFRSEEHLHRWLKEQGHAHGGTMTSGQGFELGRRWYAGRLEASWRPMSTEQKIEAFRAVGLVDPFWNLE